MYTWIQGYVNTCVYGYMGLKMVHISDISNPFPHFILLRDSTLHTGPLFDSKSESELSESSSEMYGASEQSGLSLRFIASEKYGVSKRSGELESSGASIEEWRGENLSRNGEEEGEGALFAAGGG